MPKETNTYSSITRRFQDDEFWQKFEKKGETFRPAKNISEIKITSLSNFSISTSKDVLSDDIDNVEILLGKVYYKWISSLEFNDNLDNILINNEDSSMFPLYINEKEGIIKMGSQEFFISEIKQVIDIQAVDKYALLLEFMGKERLKIEWKFESQKKMFIEFLLNDQNAIIKDFNEYHQQQKQDLKEKSKDPSIEMITKEKSPKNKEENLDIYQQLKVRKLEEEIISITENIFETENNSMISDFLYYIDNLKLPYAFTDRVRLVTEMKEYYENENVIKIYSLRNIDSNNHSGNFLEELKEKRDIKNDNLNTDPSVHNIQLYSEPNNTYREVDENRSLNKSEREINLISHQSINSSRILKDNPHVNEYIKILEANKSYFKKVRAIHQLRKGNLFLKYSSSFIPSVKKRLIRFHNDMISFGWKKKRFSLLLINSIIDGNLTKNFIRYSKSKFLEEDFCFSLTYKKRTIDLQAQNVIEKEKFIENLMVVKEMDFQEVKEMAQRSNEEHLRVLHFMKEQVKRIPSME